VDFLLFTEMIDAIDLDGKGEVNLLEFHAMTEAALSNRKPVQEGCCDGD
jgi:hypothetical protein